MSTREPILGVPGVSVVVPAAAPEASTNDDTGLVRIVDTSEPRVRQPTDLIGMIVAGLGIVLVLLMSVYAHGTTEGVTEDVRNFSTVLAQILVVPVALLQVVVMVVAPAAVLVELGMRRLGRQAVESIAAAAAGFVIGALFVYFLLLWGSENLVDGISVGYGSDRSIAIPVYAAAVASLLSVAGPRTRRRTVAWSWNVLFFTFFVLFLTNQVSLPGVLISLLLGRLVGFAVRYVSGVLSERAYGSDLVEAVRRAGFTPSTIIRVRDVWDDAARDVAAQDPITDFDAEGEIVAELHVDPVVRDDAEHPVTITEDASIAPDLLPEDRRDDPAETTSSDPSAVALSRAGDTRVYAMYTAFGVRRDVVVLDGDRQVVGFLTRIWRALRLRGVEGRAAISLRAVAEREALLSYAATSAGVRTPRLLGIGGSADSMVLVQEHAAGAVSLRDLPPDHLTDDVLTETWRQLRTAHSSGLAHRALTSDVLLVGTTSDAPEVWITGWEQGDIASSELARRMDLTQMVALLALRVGARRAVDSAVAVLPDEDIAAIGPLLQPVALPRSTRDEIRAARGLLNELRAALVERLPQAVIEPEEIVRFGTRRILTMTLTIVALVVIFTTINFEQITEAISQANPWWAVASFALGLLTWLGAALTLVAFSPVKLPMFRAIAKQAAASFVALAAPAGVGAAALDLRMLTRRGVNMALAVATVAVVQASQFVVTIVILLILMVSTGKGGGGLIEMPSTPVLIAIAGVAVLVVATLLVPRVRAWIVKKVRPTMQQVWPRLSEIMGQPGRLAVGLTGNVIQALSYILAFDAALAAFGQDLSLIDASIIYLVGNAAGAVVPTPGGIGTIELALTGGLTAAGVPAGIALSVTVVFRVATYWARIPIGWVAMRFLQRVGDL